MNKLSFVSKLKKEDVKMKKLLKILAVVTALSINLVMAQEDISGTWQGVLNLGGDSKLTVQFIMEKQADGSWSAVVNSPDMGGIKNIKANSATFDGSNLNIDVAELSGGYAGVFKDGAFAGTWSQAGSSMPLNLSPYTKPVMSQKEIDTLLGEWIAKLKVPAGDLTLVFRFAQNDAGELQGFVRNPDGGGGNETPTADIMLNNGDFSMKVPAAQVLITGKMTDKDFTGKFNQGGQQLDLTMAKGKYEPPKSVLSLSKEVMDKLMGEWNGELNTPVGAMTVVYRFVTNKDGEYSGFRESPDQGSNSTPVTDASMVDGKLTLKTPGPGGEFNGKLEGDTITGQAITPMGPVPLTLKKGKFVPPSYQLTLSKENMDQLLGKWQGKLNTPQRALTMILRFEENGDGEYYGFVDSPDQGNTSLKIIKASLTGDELSVETKFPKGQFKGKLDGNTLDGNWMQGPANLPLKMTKQ